MDHPRLFETIDFLQSIGSVTGEFLQLDGLRSRNTEEITQWMSGLKAHRVKKVNFTFYGLEDYHDRFAARQGDFDYLSSLARSAIEHELEVSAGIPLNSENSESIDALIEHLQDLGISQVFLFVPHEEGRGIHLQSIRFSEENYMQLGKNARRLFNRNRFKTEGEWVRTGAFMPVENRMLLISLTPDNIENFEEMSFAEAIRYIEELDDEYYRQIPTIENLARHYGDPDGKQFYGQRDLYRHYQKIYIRDHQLEIVDVTDERFCGSRRY